MIKSIHFSPPVADDMVRAILADRKTAARLVVRFPAGCNPKWTGYIPDGPVLYGSNNIPAAKSPCRPGDILYVQETWAAWSRVDGISPTLYYKADGNAPSGIKWHPSIHMPREAARIFLRVTDVRVEKLRWVDDEGVVAEGWDVGDPFDELWDSTIKPANRASYGWEANPWVWVIEFERISEEEAMRSA